MRRSLLVALLTLLTVASCASVQPPVALQEGNLALLTGTWAGTFQRRARHRTLELDTPVTLEVKGERPMRGRFALGTGTIWDTSVELRGGKIFLGFDQAMREFTLTRGVGGALALETSYTDLLGGWPVHNRVVLEKK